MMHSDRSRIAVALAVALAACAVQAVDVGDVLRFAADGGLHEVTVGRRLSPTALIGTLDGYGSSFNTTITEGANGWRMEIDDWRTRRVWHVTGMADACTGVTVSGKPARVQGACRALHPAPSADVNGRLFRKVATAAEIVADWPSDPVANEVDVLIVFDKTAVKYLNAQKRTLYDFAESQIAKMNVALANSGLADDFKVTLCGAYAADFDVTRDCGSSKHERLDYAAMLAAAGEDNAWQAIRDERDRVGADIVMILANSQPTASSVDYISGTVGISFGLEYDSAKKRYGFEKGSVNECRDYAYGACDIRVVEYDNTFGHEVGHVLGAGHSDLINESFSQPGPQLFMYSAAFMYQDPVDLNYYYTIMGYDSTDGRWDTPTYAEIPYYSSPLLRHPVTGSVLGNVVHDNVRTMRETYALVSQYRVRQNAEPAPEPEPPVVPVVHAEWNKARTLRGGVFRALPAPYDVCGIFELKCGKANARTGVAKVSAALTGLDGKKTRFSARSVMATNDTVTVVWDTLSVVVTGASFSGGDGLSGGLSVRSVTVGGALSAAAPRVRLTECDFAPGGEVQTQLLPMEGEPVIVNGVRWTFNKAAKVSYAKDRASGEYRLKLDDTKNRTNLSALRCTYASKTGTFKGSFKIYVLAPSSNGRFKLKKFNAKIAGVVIDGSGYGQASIAKPASGPWPVTVGE